MGQRNRCDFTLKQSGGFSSSVCIRYRGIQMGAKMNEQERIQALALFILTVFTAVLMVVV